MAKNKWKLISVYKNRYLFVRGKGYPRPAIRVSKEDLYKDGKPWAVIEGNNIHDTTIEVYNVIKRFKTKTEAITYAKSYMKAW